MLLVYPKAEKDNIPGHILRQIREAQPLTGGAGMTSVPDENEALILE